MPYAELHCKTNFSFLRGASHPDELCARAAALGYSALAITDCNTLAGVVRMHVAAKEHGIRPLVGAEITPEDAPPILLFPTDRAAYGRLCRLITNGRLRMPKGGCRIAFADIEEHADGLIGIMIPQENRTAIASEDSPHRTEPRCGAIENRDSIASGNLAHPSSPQAPKGRQNRPPAGPRPQRPTCDHDALMRYRAVFGDRLYLAAEFHRDGRHEARRDRLLDLSRRCRVPLVAAGDVHYHTPDRRPLQDVLTCIREHCTLPTAGGRLMANAERHLRPIEEIERLYAGLPGAVDRTGEVAERCRFSLDELHYEYPEELCPPGRTPIEFLRELTESGARSRFGDRPPARTRRLLDHELALIQELRYESYFLTVWDLVRFARSRGILCQGRGSAANSAVCYCLGITAVDPDRHDLLFERFVSRERNEPPDIDVDFEHERREEVFQYIYRKYGRERAGITAEVITYRPRSAVRDVGKALGLSLECVDALAGKLEWWDRPVLPPERLREAGLDPAHHTVRCLNALVRQILGFPRHLSQHVGGFVITRGPLCEMVPLENAAMPDRTFIEWDKNDIDELGILKVDCLALGMLTCLNKCFALINASDGATKRRSDGGKEEKSDGAMEPGVPPLQRWGREWQTKQRGDEDESEATGDGAGGMERIPCASTCGRAPAATQGSGEQDGDGPDVSRPDRLAAGNGAGEGGVPRHGSLSGDGAIRARHATAPGGSVHPVEHRGRSRPAVAGGLSPLPADGTGLVGRDPDATDPVDGTRPPSGGIADHEPDGGNGPDSASPHPQPGREAAIGKDPAQARNAPGSPLAGASPPRNSPSSPRGIIAPSLSPNPPSSLRRSIASSPPPNSPPSLSLDSIPPEDPAVYDMLCRADSVGVFQVESRAQMSMLPRLRPRNFYDLVIEVAIVRPGPIQGGMVHPYLRRRNGEEPITYPSPALQEVLHKTLGVPLFQEQAMRLAMVAAGFSPGEADQLRRAMGAWRRPGVIEQFRERMLRGMMANGLSRQYAEQTFEQIAGFGEYGFPESHAASFALLVYASAWLKRYYPAAYAAALINSQPMGFYAPAQIIRDARQHGVEVRPIDVNHSDYDCTLEPPAPGPEARAGARPAIRLGMRLVKGISHEAVRGIETARRDGPFRSVADLARRSGAARATLARLASADAFRSMGLDRRQALWDVLAIRDELPLLADLVPDEAPAPLPRMTLRDEVLSDYDGTGLSLKAHPIALVRAELNRLDVTTAARVKRSRQGEPVRVAGLVLVRQRPGTAKGIIFVTLEDETDVTNLVIRPAVYERFRRAAEGFAWIAEGRVERAGDVVHVQTARITDLSDALDRLRVLSRDFH